MKSKVYLQYIIVIGLLFILGTDSLALAKDTNNQYLGFQNRNATLLVEPTPVPGGPGFISLAPAAFTGHEANLPRAFWGSNIYNPNGIPSNYVAPITLPNGATITKIVAYYLDNLASGDLTLTLVDAPLNDYSGYGLAEITSSGSNPSYRYSEVIPTGTPVIDQQTRIYYFLLNLPPSMDVKFAGLRVDYTYPNQLPLVQK